MDYGMEVDDEGEEGEEGRVREYEGKTGGMAQVERK